MTEQTKSVTDLLMELDQLRAAIEPKRVAVEDARREHQGACDAAAYVERQISELGLVGPNVRRRIIALPNGKVGIVEYLSATITAYTSIDILFPEAR